MEEHFKDYNDIVNRINESLMQIRGYREAMTLKGISYDAIPKSTTLNADIAFYLGEIEEIEEKLKELKEKRDILKKKHEQEINKLSDNRYKTIIRMICLEKLPINKVADVLEISVSHTKRLKRKAGEEFLRVNNKLIPNDTNWYFLTLEKVV